MVKLKSIGQYIFGNVHTNFVSLQLIEDSYNKLQNLDFFQRCGFNLWITLERTSFDSSLRELWCKSLWLDLVRTIFNYFESLTASLLQAWKLLTAWIFAQLLSFFFTWRLASNDLPEFFIYRAQEKVFQEDLNSSSFEFEIKDNLSLIRIWF